MYFSNKGTIPNSSTLNIADPCMGFHPKRTSQVFSLCLALCRATKSMAPRGPSHTYSVLQFGWSCPRCYLLWTYPVRWAGQVDCIPILRMENLSLGALCEEMETREFESLFQGHTASKWRSLDSDPDEGCLTPPSCLFKEHCVRFFSTQLYVMFFSP